MEDSTQFALSEKARDIAMKFKDEGWFNDASEAGVFAAAYVVKNYPDFDPLTYIPHDGLGTKYNYSSFDSDGTWLNFLKARYKTETPRVCMKNLIIFGLEKISDIVTEHGMIRISDFI